MFNDNFEIFLADTPESRALHYSIRYQVYCEEMGFEKKEDFPLKKEFDENDKGGKSVHFIAQNKITGKWVGAMRLIFKRNELLPIEQSCKLDEMIGSNNFYDTVELSRLCLLKDIRRNFKDVDPPHGLVDEENNENISNKTSLIFNHQQMSRMVLWGLLHAAVEYGSTNNIMNCYFMTTKALAKVLKRGGLKLISIGEPCNHKGERYPFKMNTVEVYKSDVWKNEYRCGFSLFSNINKENLIQGPEAA